MNNCLKKRFILIIISFLYIVIAAESGFCACVDLDGDGRAETCIGGSSGGYSVPTPSTPKPSSVNSGSTTHSNSSSHTSSFKKQWDSVDGMTSDIVNSIIQKKKQQEMEKQYLLEQQKLQAELQKKQAELDAVKKKMEDEKNQQIMAKQREKNNQWLDSIEKTPDQNTKDKEPDNISGMVKLLRNPDNLDMMKPDSDIRTSDLDHIKLKNQVNKSKNPKDDIQSAYFGPEPASLNPQELQYQIKLLDMQIAKCDAGGTSACSPQFLNMLIKEKEKYVCEMMARGPVNNSTPSVNEGVLSKVKRIDTTSNTNNSYSGSQSSGQSTTQVKKLNLHGTYAVNK